MCRLPPPLPPASVIMRPRREQVSGRLAEPLHTRGGHRAQRRNYHCCFKSLRFWGRLCLAHCNYYKHLPSKFWAQRGMNKESIKPIRRERKTNIDHYYISGIYMLSYLIFLATLRSRYDLHFTDIETEVQRGNGT